MVQHDLNLPSKSFVTCFSHCYGEVLDLSNYLSIKVSFLFSLIWCPYAGAPHGGFDSDIKIRAELYWESLNGIPLSWVPWQGKARGSNTPCACWWSDVAISITNWGLHAKEAQALCWPSGLLCFAIVDMFQCCIFNYLVHGSFTIVSCLGSLGEALEGGVTAGSQRNIQSLCFLYICSFLAFFLFLFPIFNFIRCSLLLKVHWEEWMIDFDLVGMQLCVNWREEDENSQKWECGVRVYIYFYILVGIKLG